jgi:type VI protein secretion system component VasK
MSNWQKIGLAISILWVFGLLIFLGVVHSTWNIVGNVLFAANLNSLTLWTVMLGPVVLLWLIGIITGEVVRRMRERQSAEEEEEEEEEEQYDEDISEGLEPFGQGNVQGRLWKHRDGTRRDGH